MDSIHLQATTPLACIASIHFYLAASGAFGGSPNQARTRSWLRRERASKGLTVHSQGSPTLAGISLTCTFGPDRYPDKWGNGSCGE
jgi:hypothetical protein